MNKAVTLLCLAGVAGLWGWAVFWPKSAEPLPQDLVGEFLLYRYEQPKDAPRDDPYPPDQRHHFTFGADGRYLVRIFVTGGYEMRRQEGIAEMEEDAVLKMTQVSVDRVEERAGPWRYATSWGKDNSGRFLRLREIDKGHSLYLRPVK